MAGFVWDVMDQLRRFCLPPLLAAVITGAHAQTAAGPDPSGGAPRKAGAADGSAATSPAAVAQAGTSAVVLDIAAVDGVIGKGVKSYNGEDLGHIVDLLVTPGGQVRAAILQFGGVLGVGDRKVAVDWSALDFKTSAKGAAILALTRNQVRVSPEYKSGDPVVVLETAKANAAPVEPPPPGPGPSPAKAAPDAAPAAPSKAKP